jgi:NADH:ubiquinone oxidoreductase subunit D
LSAIRFACRLVMIADLIVILGSLDPVFGEVDR